MRWERWTVDGEWAPSIVQDSRIILSPGLRANARHPTSPRKRGEVIRHQRAVQTRETANGPLRSIHRAEGWTPQTLAEHGIPALKSSFYKLDRSADIFNWDAI